MCPSRKRSQFSEDLKQNRILLDDHSEVVPPDPIPNSVVKHFCADGSVGLPHVRVGHHQAPHLNPQNLLVLGVFFVNYKKLSRVLWKIKKH